MTKAVELAQVASTGVSEAFKNRVINGSMVIAQRGTGAVADGFMVDRFQAFENTAGVFSWQQVSVAPEGFNFSARCTVTTANSSPSSSDVANFQHIIEGFNVADLGWGTANAKTVTLSFWIRSSLTGNFGASILNSAVNRSYPFLYTISAANTWEYKTVTIPGDTSGTWLTDNGIGLRIMFNIGGGSTVLGTANTWAGSRFDGATGSTNILATLNATWQITGVQLEVGTTATNFEYLDYGNILRQCQRYCYGLYNSENATGDGGVLGWGYSNSGNVGVSINKFPVSMRTSPSLTTIASANALEVAYPNGTVSAINSNTVTTNSGLTTRDTYILIYTSASSSDGTGQHLRYATSPTSTLLFFSAEL